MSYSASLLGGNGDTLSGEAIGPDDDAYYRIDASDVFVDRFDSTGDSVVDATGNPNAIRVELGSGTDTVYGGSGSDTVWAGGGNDIVRPGDGSNTVSGAAGNDSIEAGSGADSLLGGSGADTLHAGAGNDYVAGGSGADSIRGEAGNDSLFGGSGADSLYGQDGDDLLVGGSGADLLIGGAGNDSMVGGSGGDVFAFDNGFGQDVISDFSAGDQLNLAADLNGTGITTAQDLVDNGMITGGTTASGTQYTLITIGTDTIRLEKVDSADFISDIDTWVKVG